MSVHSTSKSKPCLKLCERRTDLPLHNRFGRRCKLLSNTCIAAGLDENSVPSLRRHAGSSRKPRGQLFLFFAGLNIVCLIRYYYL